VLQVGRCAHAVLSAMIAGVVTQHSVTITVYCGPRVDASLITHWVQHTAVYMLTCVCGQRNSFAPIQHHLFHLILCSVNGRDAMTKPAQETLAHLSSHLTRQPGAKASNAGPEDIVSFVSTLSFPSFIVRCVSCLRSSNTAAAWHLVLRMN
jgi:hypothetical protein